MLNSGEKVGAYTVVSKLGAGGMGEVYRARDERLGRDVALKILRSDVLRDEQRMARFQREAQVLAALNHTNIAAIYGIEGADSARALVMELVPGPTLAERIQAGALPLDEALPIARQVAEALEYAHERGIVHRDLKPANIKLTPEGQAKVLDFGLAKALQEDAASPDISNSPTMSMAATKAGIILGTAAYMSPEQAKGRAVDRRTDVWAFGCVLYEMLAGKHAFPGEDVSETLAAIIRGEPDWSALPASAPAAITNLIRRCLQKDVKRRLQAIGEARIAIEESLEAPSIASTGAAQAGTNLRSQRWLWAIAASSVIAAIAFGVLYFTRPVAQSQIIRADIPTPENATFDFVGSPNSGPPAISPDGKWVVFAAHVSSGRPVLWLHNLNDGVARPLAGTEGGAFPFWSPDSTHIGFFANEKLRKIPVSGGLPIDICDAPSGRGGAWNGNSQIVFSADANSPLRMVSAAGGPAKEITQLDSTRGETSHRWPQFLPDGKHFAYLGRSGIGGSLLESAAIWIGSIEGGSPRLFIRAASNTAFAAGRVLFARENVLVAQRFDLAKLELLGEPQPILDNMQFDPSFSRGVFSVSENGLLIFQAGGSLPGTRLAWFNRQGKEIGGLGEPGTYVDLRLSPDARKAAVAMTDAGPPDLWIYDAVRGLRTRFTFDPSPDTNPVWSPDGKRIVYRSTPRGIPDLYVKTVEGTDEGQLLLQSDVAKYPRNWSADGRFIAYEIRGIAGKLTDIWILPVSPPGPPQPFLETRFREGQPQFSPDGRWMAYVSDESRRNEVYVAPFPNAGRKWQISNGGGSEPFWRADGKELFYLGEDNMIRAVEVDGRSEAFTVGTVKPLFRASVARRVSSYDVTPDGQRFLLIYQQQEQNPNPVSLLMNWPEMLKKR